MAKIYKYLDKVNKMYNKINDNEVVLIGRHSINIQCKFIKIRLGTSVIDNKTHFNKILIFDTENANINDNIKEIRAKFPYCCESTCDINDLIDLSTNNYNKFIVGEHNPSTIDIEFKDFYNISKILLFFKPDNQYRMLEVKYSLDGNEWFTIEKNEAMLNTIDGSYQVDMSRFECEDWLAKLDPETTLITLEDLERILNDYVTRREVDDYIKTYIFKMKEDIIDDIINNFRRNKLR